MLPGQRAVQRGDRDADPHQVARGQALQDVEVAHSTPADLVTIVTGWLNRSSTSSTDRVSRSVRSTG